MTIVITVIVSALLLFFFQFCFYIQFLYTARCCGCFVGHVLRNGTRPKWATNTTNQVFPNVALCFFVLLSCHVVVLLLFIERFRCRRSFPLHGLGSFHCRFHPLLLSSSYDFFVKGEERVTLVFSRVNFVYSFVSFRAKERFYSAGNIFYDFFLFLLFRKLGDWEFLPFFHLFFFRLSEPKREQRVFTVRECGICWLVSGTLWDCMRFSQNFESTTESGVLKRGLDCVSLMIFMCQPSFWRGVWIAWSVVWSMWS